MRKLIFLALLGIAAALASVYIYNEKPKNLPPVAVSYNPYANGIFATGIVESFQENGSNVSVYPEVSGVVTQVFVENGQLVEQGGALLSIDDSIQRAVVNKDRALLDYALTSLTNVQSQLDKIQTAYNANAKSISRNALDNAVYAVKLAQDNVAAAQSQYESDKALLDKYVVKATSTGKIFRVVPAVGDYISPQGAYDVYTESLLPIIQMGSDSQYLQVRAYVDEILATRLPKTGKLVARLFVRGLDNKSLPLEFVNLQPYTIPNIELSNQRNERVDVRVLPIVFKFIRPDDINIFPGQLVDVYIKGTT